MTEVPRIGQEHRVPDEQQKPAVLERIELILQELDSLPTLGPVAVRLLELTADNEANASEVIELVQSDPSLASKVLALCRCHERGRASNVTTVDRAVLLLGFEAVRCAVLAVQVFDAVDKQAGIEGSNPVFDREAFWLHSLAVAVTSEALAPKGAMTKDIRPSEAFMAGLLHDLGQLVLHVLLPETFDRVCRVAETHGASLDRACRELIGIDTHTPGKRLAERWGLPTPLVDVIWLSGQPLEALPPVPHRNLISLVSLADAMVRNRYITPGAHWARDEDLATIAIPAGVSMHDIEAVAENLHEKVSIRANALGLTEVQDVRTLIRSVCRANASLARANAGMRQRERLAKRQGRTLAALREFTSSDHDNASLLDVLGAIAASAGRCLEQPVLGVLFNMDPDGPWRFARMLDGDRPIAYESIQVPENAIPLSAIATNQKLIAPLSTLAPWLDVTFPNHDLSGLSFLPAAGNDGTGAAVFILPTYEDGDAVDDLRPSWHTGFVAACHRERAQQLTEQLAASNRSLTETREQLARSRTMSTLGEVAAGAAHEMNNPLTIISGRSQLLVHQLRDPGQATMAREIVEQSHNLSDMITALRSFAEPVETRVRAVNLADLVVRVVQEAPREREGAQVQVNTVFTESIPPVLTDPDLFRAALIELVKNAIESRGSRHIELRVQIEGPDGRLRVEVRDDGEGMTEHTLQHAFDPFFSARPAGRQPGLGLARARRFVDAVGGLINLVNNPSGGAIATIWLADWRVQRDEQREAA